MAVPEVGALVEVTLIGEVRHARDDVFLLRVGRGFDATDHYLPVSAAVKVLRPVRPREVLLLRCGHVSDEHRPSSPAGPVYCWRFPCHGNQFVEAIGSVTW